ncbi:unnamed protein product, partial [marine sediment metagenome]
AIYNKIGREAVEGALFEGMIDATAGGIQKGATKGGFFDHIYPAMQRKQAVANLFGKANLSKMRFLDAKRTGTDSAIQSIVKKAANTSSVQSQYFDMMFKRDAKSKPIKFAAKGGRSSDTVPALLTPGEFVINKRSADSIGLPKLHAMNRADHKSKGGDVQGFMHGGHVARSPQRLQRFGPRFPLPGAPGSPPPAPAGTPLVAPPVHVPGTPRNFAAGPPKPKAPQKQQQGGDGFGALFAVSLLTSVTSSFVDMESETGKIVAQLNQFAIGLTTINLLMGTLAKILPGVNAQYKAHPKLMGGFMLAVAALGTAALLYGRHIEKT